MRYSQLVWLTLINLGLVVFFLLALFLLVFHSLRQGIIMQHRLALNSRLSFLSLSSAGVR
jgi:hypothetical protein